MRRDIETDMEWARTALRRTLAPLLINAAWFAYWYEQMGEWE
jgi:hypothetical protein